MQKKRLFFRYLFIVFTLGASSVNAALPDWQGSYLGAYLGGGFGNSDLTTHTGTVTSTSYFITTADINAVNYAGTSGNNLNTVIAGVQAGHDWVWKQMLYGVVMDYGMLSLNSTNRVNGNTYPDNSDQYSIFTSLRTNWLFTLRGRLGYLVTLRWPSVLYLTGGMAMTQLKVKNNFSDNSSYVGTGGNTTSQNQLGWTAGAGIELLTWEHASVDLEYLYVSIPSVKTTSSISNTAGGFGVPVQSLTSSFSTKGELYTSLLKVALNYRFGD